MNQPTSSEIAFQRQVLSEDHEEALSVDAAFEDLVAYEWNPKDRLIHATHIATAQAFYAARKRNNIPVAVGEDEYPAYRDARRWWNFRNAYLQKMDVGFGQNVPETPSYYMDTTKDLFAQQMLAGIHLIEGNPFYIRFYESLEHQRVDNERNGRPFRQPLFVEDTQSLEILCDTIDEVLDDRDEFIVDGSHSGTTDAEACLQTYTIKRSLAGNSRSYSIAIYEPLTSSDPVVTHHLARSLHGIVPFSASANAVTKIDSTQALDLAFAISPNSFK